MRLERSALHRLRLELTSRRPSARRTPRMSASRSTSLRESRRHADAAPPRGRGALYTLKSDAAGSGAPRVPSRPFTTRAHTPRAGKRRPRQTVARPTGARGRRDAARALNDALASDASARRRRAVARAKEARSKRRDRARSVDRNAFVRRSRARGA